MLFDLELINVSAVSLPVTLITVFGMHTMQGREKRRM